MLDRLLPQLTLKSMIFRNCAAAERRQSNWSIFSSLIFLFLVSRLECRFPCDMVRSVHRRQHKGLGTKLADRSAIDNVSVFIIS